jgi:AraC-like DNA-binding protein
MSDIKRNLIKVWQPSDLTQLELQRGFSVNRPVPRHWHEEYQFCLVESGEGDLTYRGKDFLTPPASLFIVHPGEVHSNRSFESNGCSFRTIFLETEMMEKIVTELQHKEKGLPFFPSTMIFDKNTIQQFINLHESLEQSSSSLERETGLQNFLVGLITRFAENRLSVPSYGMEQKAIKQACDYLIANYAENISLEKLARIANLSPFHFNRVFSGQFGIPPHAFQVQLRISQAKRFLREGMEIAQAALQTGFADQSHLTRHFKRVIGITPGEYR